MNSDYSGVEMKKNADGVFEVKIGPIASDMYVYRFNVDGVLTIDPSNNIVVRDGSNIESRLLIPGDLADLYDVKDVPHGKVAAVWYASPEIGMNRRMWVYTPPGYDTSNQSYPVLYLLHGGGGDEDAWIGRGRANYIMDNLIAQKKAEPMIVVITNGVATMEAAPGERPLKSILAPSGAATINVMSNGLFEESLVKDVIPYIEKSYRVKTDANNRALAGLSMGGLHTMNTFMAHPDMFGYINVMSSGWFTTDKAMYERGDKRLSEIATTLNNTVKYLRFTQGGPEDISYNNGMEMLKVFDKNKIKYESSETPGGHSWNVWRKDLKDFAPKLFK